jgi:hypothetical protein
MEEPPGQGPDVVEEVEGGFGLSRVDGTGIDEELEMTVDLFGRGVGDSPVVIAVSA